MGKDIFSTELSKLIILKENRITTEKGMRKIIWSLHFQFWEMPIEFHRNEET